MGYRIVNRKTVHSQELLIADFTDNTDATGYIDIEFPLPAHTIPVAWTATVIIGFTGDTTAKMQVGVSGDLNRYSAVTTGSCLAADVIGAAVPSENAMLGFGTAQTLRVTVTGGSDFGAITAGKMVVSMHFDEVDVYAE